MSHVPSEEYYRSLPRHIAGAGAIFHDQGQRALLVKPSYIACRGAPRAGLRERPSRGRPPDLVKLLRAHIKQYGNAPDGRIFQTSRGGIIQDSAYGADWAGARAKALTTAQHRSPLGRRREQPASPRAPGTQDAQPGVGEEEAHDSGQAS
jgi:hypothetical protein